jgi:hypothetical protein
VQVRRHLESEDCLVTGRVRALRLNLRADLNRPSATLSNSALLRPRRSRTTCKNAGLHSGEPSIADKDEAAGSSPARPTNWPVTSGNAGHRILQVQPNRVDPVWDEVLRALLLLSRTMRLSGFFAVPRSWVCPRWSVAQLGSTAVSERIPCCCLELHCDHVASSRPSTWSAALAIELASSVRERKPRCDLVLGVLGHLANRRRAGQGLASNCSTLSRRLIPAWPYPSIWLLRLRG